MLQAAERSTMEFAGEPAVDYGVVTRRSDLEWNRPKTIKTTLFSIHAQPALHIGTQISPKRARFKISSNLDRRLLSVITTKPTQRRYEILGGFQLKTGSKKRPPKIFGQPIDLNRFSDYSIPTFMRERIAQIFKICHYKMTFQDFFSWRTISGSLFIIY